MPDMDDDGQDILEGLTQSQKARVHGWIDEFRLSLHELSAWRKDREVFVKSVKYKVPVETPVDLICRDIYELKLFGLRVADFFHKNGEPAFLKLCGRLFTREEAMRWVLTKSHLQKPFMFGKGEPQKILNNLPSSTRSTRKRDSTASELESRDPKQRSIPPYIKSVVGGVGRASQGSSEERPATVDTADQKPSQEELDRASANFARTASTEVSQANVPVSRLAETSGNPTSTARVQEAIHPARGYEKQRALPKHNTAVTAFTLNAATTHGSPGMVTTSVMPSSQSTHPGAQRKPSPVLKDAMITGRLPENPGNALRVVTPQSRQTLAIVQQPLQCLVPLSCGNPAYTGAPIYTFTTNAQIQTIYPALTRVPPPVPPQDESSKAYQAMVEIYLKQFKVEVRDFSIWLNAKYGSNSVPQDELFARAELMLSYVANVLVVLETNSSSDFSRIATFAKHIGIPEESLQKWFSPENRILFFEDRAALQYNMFQRIFSNSKSDQGQYLEEMEEIMDFHKPAQFIDVKSVKDPVNLVIDVLDFYSLDSEVLNTLPMECNRGFRETSKRSPLELLLYDLDVVISHQNEISMYSSMFSPDETASCFEIPPSRLPPPKNMFHVSLEAAVEAILMRDHLRLEFPDFGDEEDQKVDPQRIRDLLEKYQT